MLIIRCNPSPVNGSDSLPDIPTDSPYVIICFETSHDILQPFLCSVAKVKCKTKKDEKTKRASDEKIKSKPFIFFILAHAFFTFLILNL